MAYETRKKYDENYRNLIIT